MIRKSLKLIASFQEITKRSSEECGDELNKITRLILSCFYDFHKLESKAGFQGKKDFCKKCTNSLVYTCYLELARLSSHILFFAYNGLYRHAFNDIRYILESIIQSFYIDSTHPHSSFDTKIEILDEIEDKREYRAIGLIEHLSIGENKNSLQREYTRLSEMIHHSHKQIVTTIYDVFGGEQDKARPVRIDCKEVMKIYESMKVMYDIFFSLYITYFPEFKEFVKKDPEYTNIIKIYNLHLLSKAINS